MNEQMEKLLDELPWLKSGLNEVIYVNASSVQRTEDGALRCCIYKDALADAFINPKSQPIDIVPQMGWKSRYRIVESAAKLLMSPVLAFVMVLAWFKAEWPIAVAVTVFSVNLFILNAAFMGMLSAFVESDEGERH